MPRVARKPAMQLSAVVVALDERYAAEIARGRGRWNAMSQPTIEMLRALHATAFPNAWMGVVRGQELTLRRQLEAVRERHSTRLLDWLAASFGTSMAELDARSRQEFADARQRAVDAEASEQVPWGPRFMQRGEQSAVATPVVLGAAAAATPPADGSGAAVGDAAAPAAVLATGFVAPSPAPEAPAITVLPPDPFADSTRIRDRGQSAPLFVARVPGAGSMTRMDATPQPTPMPAATLGPEPAGARAAAATSASPADATPPAAPNEPARRAASLVDMLRALPAESV